MNALDLFCLVCRLHVMVFLAKLQFRWQVVVRWYWRRRLRRLKEKIAKREAAMYARMLGLVSRTMSS